MEGHVCSRACTTLPPCLIPSLFHPLLMPQPTCCKTRNWLSWHRVSYSPTPHPVVSLLCPRARSFTQADVHMLPHAYTLIWWVNQYLQYNGNLGSDLRNARATQQGSTVWSYGSNTSKVSTQDAKKNFAVFNLLLSVFTVKKQKKKCLKAANPITWDAEKRSIFDISAWKIHFLSFQL